MPSAIPKFSKHSFTFKKTIPSFPPVALLIRPGGFFSAIIGHFCPTALSAKDNFCTEKSVEYKCDTVIRVSKYYSLFNKGSFPTYKISTILTSLLTILLTSIPLLLIKSMFCKAPWPFCFEFKESCFHLNTLSSKT